MALSKILLIMLVAVMVVGVVKAETIGCNCNPSHNAADGTNDVCEQRHPGLPGVGKPYCIGNGCGVSYWECTSNPSTCWSTNFGGGLNLYSCDANPGQPYCTQRSYSGECSATLPCTNCNDYARTCADSNTVLITHDVCGGAGVCQNGVQTMIDCPTGQICTGAGQCIPSPEVCSDNIDNDGDGYFDCRDRECRTPTVRACGTSSIVGQAEGLSSNYYCSTRDAFGVLQYNGQNQVDGHCCPQGNYWTGSACAAFTECTGDYPPACTVSPGNPFNPPDSYWNILACINSNTVVACCPVDWFGEFDFASIPVITCNCETGNPACPSGTCTPGQES